MLQELQGASSTTALVPARERQWQRRYDIVGPLGVGGMATVLLGRAVEDGRHVAIKRLHDFIAEDASNVAILLDEADLASSIRHPNVVAIVEVDEGDEGEAPALVMDWVDGVNLATLAHALTSSETRLPLDVAVAIMRGALAGLHAAHEARRADGLALEIIHRDVSPQNILVGFDGVTRITDFGVAKATWRRQSTELGAIKGKLGYMAPEQLDGRADRRADIYSAGAVLWELMTGSRLRPADGTGPQILVQILQGHVTPPSKGRPEAATIDDVVMRALARHPEDRFETAEEMALALASRIVPASPERVAEVLAATLGRNPPRASTQPRPVAPRVRRAPTPRPRRDRRARRPSLIAPRARPVLPRARAPTSAAASRL